MPLAMIHPFEEFPLRYAGLILGVALVVSHAFALVKADWTMNFLRSAPRNHRLGQVLMLIATCWFWLLIAPASLSPFSMALAEFEAIRGLLQLLVPVLGLLVTFTVKDFLFVRALGTLGLLITYPLLEAAFLKEPASRLLIPIWCYAVIILSLFWVGMPYVFRNQVEWLTKSSSRFRAFALGGLLYGVAVLVSALAFYGV